MKKSLVFIISLVLLFNAMVLSSAQSYQTWTSRGNTLTYRFIPEVEDSTDNYYNISGIFGVDGKSTHKLSQIKYNIIQNDSKNDTNLITMNGELFLNKKSYSFESKGEAKKITINDKTLLEGALEGHIHVNNKEIGLTIHLQTFGKNNETFITMSLYDAENNINAFLIFGKEFLTEEFVDKIKNNNLQDNQDLNTADADFQTSQMEVTEIAQMENADFQITTQSTQSFVNYNNSDHYTHWGSAVATGLRPYVYRSTPLIHKNLQFRLYSRTSEIWPSYPNWEEIVPSSAGVSLDTQNIYRVDTTAPIAGQTPLLNPNLANLLHDTLGAFGVPSNLLLSIFDVSRGSVDVTGNGFTSKSVTINSFSPVKMESNPVLIFFGIQTGTLGVKGSATYSIKYRISNYSYRYVVIYHTASYTQNLSISI